MATNNLTTERLLQLLIYKPETGIFTHRVPRCYVKAGTPAGSLKPSGYIRVSIDGRMYQAHRLAWFYVHGEFPESDIDHINGVRNDNRICNLRPCARFENCQNIPVVKTNTSGLVGARFNKLRRKWLAAISVNNQRLHLGSFNIAIEAHQAYVSAKAKLHTFQPTIRA